VRAIKLDPLSQRILTAAVVVPPVVAAIWFGTPYFQALIVVGVALLGWEWADLCRFRRQRIAAMIFAIGLVVVLVFALVFGPGAGLGALVIVSVSAIVPVRMFHPASTPWVVGGQIYVMVPCLALLALRHDPAVGHTVVLWLFVIVWATDIGSYVAGRSFGGPKLAPKISPNKTWSGLAGGMLSAGVLGGLLAVVFFPSAVAPAAILGVILGGIAQIGDLIESRVKRHFDVKDSGNVFPGHGGMFDRVDGLLLVAPAAIAIALVTDGGLLGWK
jgi:phosphatidate cytidylyltransferase